MHLPRQALRAQINPLPARLYDKFCHGEPGGDWLVADAHGPLSTLTALSVVPEHKLRLCHDRDELTIGRCDARLPHHRSPPADPPPLKWSDLRYVFDIKEDCNGKEAIQA